MPLTSARWLCVLALCVATSLKVEASDCVPSPDLDGNGVVDAGDLGALLASWGACDPPCFADLDGDGSVDATDLAAQITAWGPSERPWAPLFVQPCLAPGWDAVRIEAHDFDKDGDVDVALLAQGPSSPAVVLAWQMPGVLEFEREAHLLPAGPPYPDLVTGDFNGDGWSDLFVVYGDTRLMLNDGAGGLLPPQVIWPNSYTRSARGGDLDGDGRAEVVLIEDSTILVLFKWDGATMQRSHLLDPPGSILALELFDVDRDGDLDLAMRRGGPSTLDVWLNDGAGTFAHAQSLSPVAGELHAADLDGDGWPDLVSGGGAVRVCFNDGAGALLPWVVGSINSLGDFTLGDIDGDGDIDLFGRSHSGLRLRVALNDGQGELVLSQDSLIVPIPDTLEGRSDPTIVDLDGDCVMDGLAACAAGVALLPGRFNGFLAPTALTLSSGPSNASLTCNLVDLDGDGQLDLLGGMSGLARAAWGTGTADFALGAQVYFDNFNFKWFRAFDVTADGLPEIFAINSINGLLGTSRNLGGRTFGPPMVVATGSNPVDVRAIRLDADPFGDAAVLCAGVGVMTHRGKADGSVEAGMLVPLPGAQSLAVGDLDGDGKDDMLVGMTDGSVRPLIGDGASFAPDAPFDEGLPASALALADLDGDGDLDVVVVHDETFDFDEPATVRTWLNSGEGFVAHAEQSVRWHPRRLILVDIDKDGDLDVLATDVEQSSLVILRGDGAGGLAAEEHFGLDKPSEAGVGDLDLDGWLDVVGCSADFGHGSVLLNRGGPMAGQ